MTINDTEKGQLIMRNYNPKLSITYLVITIVFVTVYLYFGYSSINKLYFKDENWYYIFLFTLIAGWLFLMIVSLISQNKVKIKYYEKGILIPTGIIKKDYIKYSDIDYIMIPESTTKQYMWYGDFPPKIKMKHQDKFIPVKKIAKNALEFLNSKVQIKRFQGKYELENDASRSEQVGVHQYNPVQRRSERLEGGNDASLRDSPRGR